MLLCFIVGGLMLIAAVIVFCFRSKVDKELITFILTSCSVAGLFLVLISALLRVEAVRTYDELLEQKQFIEASIGTDDSVTSLIVEYELFKYNFKYDKAVNNGGALINPYLGMDLDALKLNIK